MAIEALYPSRRQSQRHNPLFIRERRRRLILFACVLGIGLALLIGVRFMPGDAAAQALPTISKAAVQAPTGPMPDTPKRKVRVIHLYSIPSDQLTTVPGKA